MTKRNSKGKHILFKRVFAWSYIPENATGFAALLIFPIPFVLLVLLIELLELAIGNVDLTVLQIVIGVLGILALQVFVSRHS